MDLDRGVAARLALLCLDGGGGLTRAPLAGPAVRGALLVDLALVGRLTDDSAALLIDTTPTGFAPADLLLAGVSADAERSLDWWLQRWHFGVPELAEHLVMVGMWTREPRTPAHPRHHYRDATDPTGQRRAGLASQVRAARSGASCDRVTAAVACVSQAGGIGGDGPGSRPAERLLSQCGEVRWIVGAVVDYLDSARGLGDANARASQQAMRATNFLT